MLFSPPRNAFALAAALTLFTTSVVTAHEHHTDKIPEGEAVSPDPLDSILWIHIIVQIVAWGIIFPAGMVLGIVKSRWHVPVQVLGTLLVVLGYFLGHKHKGRQFSHNIHSSFAPWLNFLLLGQVALGVYLRMHIQRGFLAHIRRLLVLIHGFIGKALPVVAWVQMLFGGITAMGFCQGDHLGQCLAHFIMGSAFIGYGIILTILLLVGQGWLRRSGRSQEFYDSCVIAAWGCVNTFTEHRWGGPWVRNDLQHTSMGIIWWSAGLVGIWLSRKRDGTPKRNIIPAIVIFLTGYGMSAHPQELMLSTMVHTIFGYTLMSAGAARVIEISFVLKDRDTFSVDGYDPHSFQYLTPFLLYASGFLFMGATEEQMEVLSAAHVTHVSYILILFSIAFLLFLLVNMLLQIYAVHTFGASPTSVDSLHADLNATGTYHKPDHNLSSHARFRDGETEEYDAEAAHAGKVSGAVSSGLSRVTDPQRRQVSEAQEFELDQLISDDDEEVPTGDSRLMHKVGGTR